MTIDWNAYRWFGLPPWLPKRKSKMAQEQEENDKIIDNITLRIAKIIDQLDEIDDLIHQYLVKHNLKILPVSNLYQVRDFFLKLKGKGTSGSETQKT